MSIMQEFEIAKNILGAKKYDAIDVYLTELNSNEIFLNDILYNKEQYDKFEKWYREDYFKKYKGQSFHTDKEKMRDFKKLTKEEFLKSYSYLKEEDYNITLKHLNKKRKYER